MTGISSTRRRGLVQHVRPRRLLTLGAHTLSWCGLWGSISVANVMAGAAVALAVTATGVGTAGRGGVRLRPLAQLIGLVAVDLVKSTISVAVEIGTPGDRTDEAIIAVQVPTEAQEHLLLLVVAITLTPGTAVVDTDPDHAVIYLHLLHHQQRQETEAHVHRLAELACESLPTPRKYAVR